MMQGRWGGWLLMGLAAWGCGSSDPGASGSDPSDAGRTGPGAPVLTAAVAGDGQRAPVDQAVARSPSIRVTDANGFAVPEVRVFFSVTEGGGRVEGAEADTDAEGLAQVGRWILGPTPGRQVMVAEVPGLAPVFFEATAMADDRGSFVMDGGNHQSGRIEEALQMAPSTRLLDGNGDPVVGRRVRFSVQTGGGRALDPEPVTDAEGRAALGAWILGPNPGEQRLLAETEGMPPLTFTAVAVGTDAPVLVEESFVSNIGRPWDLDFLPDGQTMLFTERGGRVRSVNLQTGEARIILEAPADLRSQGQSGMLGLAVDPDFETNRFVYTFLASTRGGQTDNRIRRWRLEQSGDGLTEDQDILTGITWGASGAHSGGRIRFGPDGHLWVTTGDTRSATVPQDPQELGGKVLRITRDGTPAPGNPSIPGARPEIYFFGVRNPQGIAFRPGTADAFICEHGPNEDDEVTRLVAGGNGGWNPNDGDGNYNGYTGALMSDPSIGGVVGPTYAVMNSAGMSGCDFLQGSAWGAWDQALLVGMLAGTRAIVLPLDAEGTGLRGDVSNTLDGSNRIRAVVQGPDGAVYVAVDADPGRILRVTPQ